MRPISTVAHNSPRPVPTYKWRLASRVILRDAQSPAEFPFLLPSSSFSFPRGVFNALAWCMAWYVGYAPACLTLKLVSGSDGIPRIRIRTADG